MNRLNSLHLLPLMLSALMLPRPVHAIPISWNNAAGGNLTITGPGPVGPTGAVHVEMGGTSPGTEYDRLTATGFSRAPSPNPGRGRTHFAIALAHTQRVELTIADVTGRHVARLQRGRLDAGEHAFDWLGATDSGMRAAAGVYFLILETEDLRQVRKVVVGR